MKCPNCGTENKDRNVCLKCGTFLQGKKLRPKDIDPAIKRKEFKRKLIGSGKSCLLSGLLNIVALAVLSVIFLLLSQVMGRFLDFVEPIIVTDENGSVVTDADGYPVYETDEEGSVILVTPSIAIDKIDLETE